MVDITKEIAFHKAHGKKATLVATFPPGRFGALDITAGKVNSFQEKPRGDGAMINGGFFVLSPEVLKYIDGDSCTWEQEPLKALAEENELMAYEHHGFLANRMDTLRDKVLLEELWQAGESALESLGINDEFEFLEK